MDFRDLSRPYTRPVGRVTGPSVRFGLKPAFLEAMGKLSYIRMYLRALAMFPVVCAATLLGQVPPGALVVSGALNFGGAIYADSFDSADPAFSTGGRYAPLKHKANGDLRSSFPFSLQGNSWIFGRVWAPFVVSSGSSSVGDTNWMQKGIQPGWVQPGTPFQFEEVTAPYSDAPQPSGGTLVIRGVTNTFGSILGDGDFLLLTNVPVSVTGIARLFAPNGFDGYIILAPGARLNMYVGTGLRLSAQGDFATDLIVYCLPTVTNVSLPSGPSFTGILYAPEADVVLSGNVEIFGSIAAKSVKTLGTCDFHYDEQISRWYPPMHPALASARFVSSVGMQFDVLGSPGLNYVIETSTNLTDWIPSSTNASPFTYTDPQASLFPNRFYRASWAP